MIGASSTLPPGLDALLRALDVSGLPVGAREVLRLQRAFALEPPADPEPSEDGDPLRRILEAALVHSPAEREIFWEVYRPWAERWGSWERRGREDEDGFDEHLPTITGHDRRPIQHRGWPVGRVLALAVVGLLLTHTRSLVDAPTESVVPLLPAPRVTESEDWAVSHSGTRTYTAWVPVFRVVRTTGGWLEVLPQLLLGGLALVGAGALGWRYRFHPWRPEVKPSPPPEGPMKLPLLPLASAGPELLDQEGAQTMVWGVGKQVAEELTTRIDLRETAQRTAAAGGMPTICYEPDKCLREVWLWLDGTVEDPALGRYCEEVAASLERAGLPVRLGFFDGFPLQLTWAEGQAFKPQELEGHRQTALVAVCTDGEVLLRHLADARGERARPLLRALARWPRLALVDFSRGASGLAGAASRFGLACIAPEGLPKFFGLGVETASARPVVESGELRTWAATLALSPRPVERAAAYALRHELGLEVSPWTFHRLLDGEDRAVPLGGQLSWADGARRNLIHWLEEAEGCRGDGVPAGSVLERALGFWEERLELEEQERQRRRGPEAERNETATRHLRMERELLRLWRDPTAAIEALWQLREEDVGEVLRGQMGRLTPWDCADRQGERLRLPWRLAGVRNLEVRFQLAELGLGGVEKGALRPPGRLVAGIGLLTSLGVALVASGIYAREPAEPKSAWALAEQVIECESRTGAHSPSGIEFVWVCGGTFMMGSADTDSEALRDEKPAHPARVDGFWMAKTETTNQQYQNLRPAKTGWSQLPVASVSWSEAQSYCQELGNEFDLPTEAEWEYAARAGSNSRWSFGDDEVQLGDYAWFRGNSEGSGHPVATLKPNPWGLFDMHGNLWEWGRDCYDENAYRLRLDASADATPADNPGRESDNCQSADAFRVVRGGSFGFDPGYLRSAYRNWVRPEDRLQYIGFRCVRRPGRESDPSTP